MATAPKIDPFAESTVDRFAPHVHDLQEFFGARGVCFGSAKDLSSFVARLESDASFRDETASMVRAAIYRERDGFSRLELMELLAMAASGTQADHVALPELREAVRKLMAFVESVFRTRWNPGAAVGGPAPRLVRDEPEETAPEQEAAPQPAPARASHDGCVLPGPGGANAEWRRRSRRAEGGEGARYASRRRRKGCGIGRASHGRRAVAHPAGGFAGRGAGAGVAGVAVDRRDLRSAAGVQRGAGCAPADARTAARCEPALRGGSCARQLRRARLRRGLCGPPTSPGGRRWMRIGGRGRPRSGGYRRTFRRSQRARRT